MWNLTAGLSLPVAMIVGCGPIVAIGGTDGETDTSDETDSDPSGPGPGSNTSPTTTSPTTTMTTTVSTTSPTECFYDSDCPPGYRCDNNKCYYDGYCYDGCCEDGCCNEFGCYEYCSYNFDCQPGYQCHYNQCEILQVETACESVPFGIGFEIPAGDFVQSLAFIDADGSPERELLVGGDGLILARIDGTTTQIAAGTYPYDIAVRDIDGDGDQDIAMFDGNAGVPRILWNDGVWTPLELPGGAYVESLVLADAEGDGLPDLVGTSSGEGVFMWRNDGGGWNEPNYYWEPSLSIASGNLDGDTTEDVVVHGYTTYALADGLNSVYELYNGTWGYTSRQLGVGNFNGTGDLDVIGVEYANGGSVVTSFVGPVLQSAGFVSTWWPYMVEVIEVADMNLDGYADVIGGGQTLSIAYGGPEPDADTIVCVSAVASPYSSYRVAAGDMSGDGRPDIALSDGSVVHVMLRTD